MQSVSSMVAVLPYPNELARDVRLRDGELVHIRAIRPTDEAGLLALFDRLSATTRYQRFFNLVQRVPERWLHHFACVDYAERLALVAERGSGATRELIGVARYEPSNAPDMREIAIVIDDRWQGRGLGTIMLDALMRAAGAHGVRRFLAFVLGDNRRMLRLVPRLATVLERSVADGVVELVFTSRSADRT